MTIWSVFTMLKTKTISEHTCLLQVILLQIIIIKRLVIVCDNVLIHVRYSVTFFFDLFTITYLDESIIYNVHLQTDRMSCGYANYILLGAINVVFFVVFFFNIVAMHSMCHIINLTTTKVDSTYLG